jgi:two-component system, chemotaxis family, protein-glutamate methylesterase/glutaminase
MKQIKVLIVDDSHIVCRTLSEILSSDPQIEVMATAADPLIAADIIRQEVPDVITLDVEMPHMDGITFLRMIMALHPIPVVICSSYTEQGSVSAFAALDYGAIEIITKPKVGVRQFLEESKIRLCNAVKAAAQSKLKSKSSPFYQAQESRPVLSSDKSGRKSKMATGQESFDKIVVVGASTGGPEALRTFLKEMPPDAPGIAIVQHMPEHFTKDFAERLNSMCRIKVKEAENNDRLVRGTALLAPGNHHMLLKSHDGGFYVEIKDGPLVSFNRPSVDVLFRSAARYAENNAVGVIMTGMGADGAAGMREMKEAGAKTIAQDEASCVIFGMPNEAIKHEGVDVVLPLEEIAQQVLLFCKSEP